MSDSPELVTLGSDDGLSTRSDKILFVALFLVGTVLIILAKTWGQSVWVLEALPPAAGVGLILLYCVLALRGPRARIREDRVGEGAYYLGFLFTLVSLSLALRRFTITKGDDTQLISSFGLALATTICGVVCRVVLQQTREGPADSEHEVRETLSTAVVALQGEVRTSVENLALLRRRVEQETAEAIGAGMKQIIADNKQGLEELTLEFKNQMEIAMSGVSVSITETQAMALESRKVTVRLLKAIEVLAEKMESAESPTEVIRPQLEELAQTIKKSLGAEAKRLEVHKQLVESIAESHKQVGQQAASAVEIISSSKAASEGLVGAIRETGAALVSITDQLSGLAKASVDSKSQLQGLVETTKAQVAESQAAFLELQKQVVSAANTIVREIGGR